MNKDELELRRDHRQLPVDEPSGLNQGTSGNISVRYGDTMLISPSASPMSSSSPRHRGHDARGEYGSWEGPQHPSSEWRFHLDIMRARPDVGAIVHTHSIYATTLAIAPQGHSGLSTT